MESWYVIRRKHKDSVLYWSGHGFAGSGPTWTYSIHQAYHFRTHVLASGIALGTRRDCEVVGLEEAQSGQEKDTPPLRLSNKETLILTLLLKEGSAYGLRLVALSNGEIKKGTVYPTLKKLEERGLVEAERPRKGQHNQPGLPRPMYSLTGSGRRALRQLYDERRRWLSDVERLLGLGQ